MRIQRLETTDAFIVFDLDDAPTAVGVTRLAPKILVDGATLLARSVTYTFAAFDVRLSGGSAGINAKPEHKQDAVAAYTTEVTPMVAENRWVTDAGSGLSAADLAPLREHDPRPDEVIRDRRTPELTVAGALAAADAAVGGLKGRRVAVDGTGALAKAAGPAIEAAGGERVTSEDECDVLLAAGRPGSIDHERAATIRARVVVPIALVPVTAKAFAVLSRAGTVYVPDFVSGAGPLLAGFDPDGGDPVGRVGALASELSAEGTGMWMAAVRRAETFLATWQDGLPFGRPLA